MPSIASRVALIAALATLWSTQPAFAQTPASTTGLSAAASSSTRPDPLDSKAVLLPLVYRSAFQGYRPNAEAAPGVWKDANDDVARIGGWRAYAKEARQPGTPEAATTPASGSASPAAAIPPAGHVGHKIH